MEAQRLMLNHPAVQLEAGGFQLLPGAGMVRVQDRNVILPARRLIAVNSERKSSPYLYSPPYGLREACISEASAPAVPVYLISRFLPNSDAVLPPWASLSHTHAPWADRTHGDTFSRAPSKRDLHRR